MTDFCPFFKSAINWNFKAWVKKKKERFSLLFLIFCLVWILRYDKIWN